MTSPLGFVVLAKRPNQPPVSAVFPEYPNGLEQAQNALEYCQHKDRAVKALHPMLLTEADREPVEFVIGAITEQ